MRTLPYTLYEILALLFRKFRKRDVTIFHVELCTALFCLLIIFVCGINRTAIYGACVAVSALIHYFTLVAVMFMGAETVVMFQKLVLVFGSTSTKFLVVAVMFMGAETVVMFQKLVIVFGSTSTKFLVTVSLICWCKCVTVSLIPRPLSDFILQLWRKNWEKAWDHCYVMDWKWWTSLT